MNEDEDDHLSLRYAEADVFLLSMQNEVKLLEGGAT
jgi:hypothetical protein